MPHAKGGYRALGPLAESTSDGLRWFRALAHAPALVGAADGAPPGAFGDDERTPRIDACVVRILALIEQEPDLSLTEIAARLMRTHGRDATTEGQRPGGR
jgi:hypothetical protein